MENREIKFRAWNGDLKQMEYCTDDEYWSIFNSKKSINWGLYHRRDGHRIATGDPKAIFNNPSILMQYTGRKDEDGKEVYEGDVVKWTHPDDEFPLTHEVEFNNELSSYMLGGSYLYEADGIEIIGNIYENPELLKE